MRQVNGIRVFYIVFYESLIPKKSVRCWNKDGRNYTKDQKTNQFHCYNPNMDFVNRMNKNVAKYKIGMQMEK